MTAYFLLFYCKLLYLTSTVMDYEGQVEGQEDGQEDGQVDGPASAKGQDGQLQLSRAVSSSCLDLLAAVVKSC